MRRLVPLVALAFAFGCQPPAPPKVPRKPEKQQAAPPTPKVEPPKPPPAARAPEPEIQERDLTDIWRNARAHVGKRVRFHGTARGVLLSDELEFVKWRHAVSQGRDPPGPAPRIAVEFADAGVVLAYGTTTWKYAPLGRFRSYPKGTFPGGDSRFLPQPALGEGTVERVDARGGMQLSGLLVLPLSD